jgi:hypothetical protein
MKLTYLAAFKHTERQHAGPKGKYFNFHRQIPYKQE